MSNTIELPAYGWAPRPYQLELFNAMVDPKIKEVIGVCARRLGKDECALNATAIIAMQRPQNIFYSTPLASQCRSILWDSVDFNTGRPRLDKVFPSELIERKDNVSMKLFLKNGSVIQFGGSDNYQSLLGQGISLWVSSEDAMVDSNATAFFRPMIAATKGKIIRISTPRGKNFLYKNLQRLQGREDAYTCIVPASQAPEVYSAEQLSLERRDLIQLYGAAYGSFVYEQEYNCSFESASLGAVWGEEIADLRSEKRLCRVPWNKSYPVHVSFDLGWSDDTALIFAQEIGREVQIIDWYKNNKHDLAHYMKVMSDKPYTYGNVYLPHDSQQHTVGAGTSVFDQVKKFGLRARVVPRTPKDRQIAYGAQLLNRCIIHSEEDLVTGENEGEKLLETLSEYKFQFDDTRKVHSQTPIHNAASHTADAFMVLATALAPDKGYVREPEIQFRPEQMDHREFPRIKSIVASQSRRQTGSAWS